jgi:hypothetical protein
MKRILTLRKLYVSLFLIFCCTIALDTISADQDGDYTYIVNNGESTITEYTGSDEEITVPMTLGGYPTVAIGGGAFYFCSSLTSVIIPDTVNNIGNSAFSSCSSLNSVTLPNNLTTIGNFTFYYCSSLNSITIPNNVITIRTHAFFKCSSLTNITIPANVSSIGSYTFAGCSSLKSITFLGLDAPTEIGENWIKETPMQLRGHAYTNSNFPSSGKGWNGLTMGNSIDSENIPPTGNYAPDSKTPGFDLLLVFSAIVVSLLLWKKRRTL